jgi:hypothetical protein
MTTRFEKTRMLAKCCEKMSAEDISLLFYCELRLLSWGKCFETCLLAEKRASPIFK